VSASRSQAPMRSLEHTFQTSRVRALTAAFSAYSGDNALVAAASSPRRGDFPPATSPRRSLLALGAGGARTPADRPGRPRRRTRRARTVAPPPATPREGKVLGHAESGTRRPVALAPRDATSTCTSSGDRLGQVDSHGEPRVSRRRQRTAGGRHRPEGDLVTDILDRLPSMLRTASSSSTPRTTHRLRSTCSPERTPISWSTR